MRIKLLGYAPDLDPTTPGAIVAMENIIPSLKGMKAAPSAQSGGYSALSEAANSLAVCQLMDGSRRTFAGGTTKLWEGSSGTWTDRSESGGYSIGADNRWSFAQFGDVTLAAAKSELLQATTGTGVDFAEVTGSPKMSHIAVSDGFIMGVNTNEATYGDQEDRWWSSAYLDYTDWTPAVSTQCVTGRIVDAPGPLRGVKTLGKGFALFKDRAIYVASYIGAPLVWQMERVPGDVGCAANSMIVDLGSALAFIGHDDVYLFDGARPVAIGGPIREWFFSDFNEAYAYRTIGAYDSINGNIWWYYVSNSNSTDDPDKAIVYNPRTQKWGTYTITIEAAALYYGDGTTFHSLGTDYSTYEDLPTNIVYDSPYWSSGNPAMTVIKTDHILYTLTGIPGDTSITLNNLGDINRFSTIRRIRPRFSQTPSSSQLEYSYDDLDGDAFTALTTVSFANGRYDLLHSSRWHRNTLKFNGEMEVIEVDVDLVPDGTE